MFHRVSFWDNVFARDYGRWNSMPCMCNGGNNWMQGWLDLAKMQFAFGCFRTGMQDLASAIRGNRQQGTQQLMTANTFYPYVNLGDGRGGYAYGAGGTSPYAMMGGASPFGGYSPFGNQQEMADRSIALKTLADSYSSKCKFSPMDASGEKWLITTKDGKRVHVDSFDELETTLSELFDGEVEDDEPKAKVDPKPSTKVDNNSTTDNADDATPIDNDGKVDGSDKTDEPKADAPEADAPKADAPKTDTPDKTGTKPKRWVRATNSDNETFKKWGTGNFEGRGYQLAARFVVDKILETYGITTDHKDKLQAAIIKQNPSVFKNDGNFADKPIWSKLDIPSKDQVLSIVSDRGKAVGPKGWDTYNTKDPGKLKGAYNVDQIIDRLLNGGFGSTTSPIKLNIGSTERNKLKEDIKANNKGIIDSNGNVTGNLTELVVPYVYQLQSVYKCTITSLIGKGWVNGGKNPNDAGKIDAYIAGKADAADAVVDELVALYSINPSSVTPAIRNRIRKDLIYFNFSCFNENGSKKDSYDKTKLDYPNLTTFIKYGCTSLQKTESSNKKNSRYLPRG